MTFNKKIARKRGEILISIEENSYVLIKPYGIIGIKLLQEFLAKLNEVDKKYPIKLHHIVDTTNVTFANPLNLFYLRQINKLQNAGWYMVIVPNPILRFVVRLTKWINKPDYIAESMKDCKRFIRLNSKDI